MPRKQRAAPLTPLELEIMQVLWAVGPATVQAVLDRVQSRRKLAYTTVQTMLTVLHRKGKVTRTLRGKAYEYAPTVSRKRATAVAMRDIVQRLFGGSAESLVMSLIENRQLSADKLAELAQLVEESDLDHSKE